jgi:hypothetical protein
MSESDSIDRVVKALLKAPEKKLKIIELANEIPIVFGALDPQVVSNRQLEINLAIAEAKAYGTHTLQAVDSLVRLQAIEDGVRVEEPEEE